MKQFFYTVGQVKGTVLTLEVWYTVSISSHVFVSSIKNVILELDEWYLEETSDGCRFSSHDIDVKICDMLPSHPSLLRYDEHPSRSSALPFALSEVQIRPCKSHREALVTDHVRSAREGNVFSPVSVILFKGRG